MQDLRQIVQDFSNVVNKEALTEEERELRRLRALPDEEKMIRILEMRKRGIPTPKIANLFDLTPKQVLTLQRKAYQQIKKDLESQTGADRLVDHLEFFGSIEDACLYEIAQLQQEDVVYDSSSKSLRQAAPEERRQNRKMRMDLLNLASKTRKTKVDMELKTGILPKEPSRMHHSLEPANEDDANRKSGKTKKELMEEALRRLDQQVDL